MRLTLSIMSMLLLIACGNVSLSGGNSVACDPPIGPLRDAMIDAVLADGGDQTRIATANYVSAVDAAFGCVE